MPAVKEFTSTIKPTWCPGCGNYGMAEAMKRALAEMGWEKHEFAMVWGIGCHGNGADFYDVQGMHALHGRSLPPAAALRLTRPDLQVIVEMGDGDGYGLGMGHFVHALRRNHDMTVIAHNNQIYGLTAGQASPTTDHLMRSVSTPGGVLEDPVNPIGIALAEGATFIARGFAGDIPHLTDLYIQAFSHKGLALVDVFQPCVTWNHLNTFQWFRERVYKLGETGWDTSDKVKAFDLSLSTFHDLTCTPETCRVPTGVYYQETGRPTYEDGLKATQQPGWKRAEKPRDVSAIVESLG
jgi:2-oxoglutarate ferredoxin oxidoreductase subunit beta